MVPSESCAGRLAESLPDIPRWLYGIELVAGPRADLDGRVHATQAVAALGDPPLMFPEIPDEELRGRMLEGARRLLEGPTG